MHEDPARIPKDTAKPTPLALARTAEMPVELEGFDDLVSLLALPALARIRAARCGRARFVAVGLTRSFNLGDFERQLSAVQECAGTRSACCTPGESCVLALALELRLGEHCGLYGVASNNLINQIHAVRILVGRLLFAHAQILDYRAPSASVTGMRMAEMYLTHTVRRRMEQGGAQSGLDRARFSLAQSVVYRSRYQPATDAELRWAEREALAQLDSEKPRMARDARELLAQAFLVILPQREIVVPDSIWSTEEHDPKLERVSIRLALLALTLGDIGVTDRVEWAVKRLTAVLESTDSSLMFRTMAGFLLAWRDTSMELDRPVLTLVGLTHVFDLPRHLSATLRDRDLSLAAQSLVENLERRLHGTPSDMYFTLLAALYETLGASQLADGDVQAAIQSYRSALATGARAQRRTGDEMLRDAVRQFELARLTEDPEKLRAALHAVDANAAWREFNAQPFLELARQIERGDLPAVQGAACGLEKDHDCAVGIYELGSSAAAYAAAGRRALRNSTMRRLSLGGRSGAEMPLSLSNFSTSSSVVIKRTTPANLDRELLALRRLDVARTSTGWRPARFVGSEPLEAGSEHRDATIAAFWQWTDGMPAEFYLERHSDRLGQLLTRLSVALAEVHLGLCPELREMTHAPPKVRQYYRGRQVGMWLRQLMPEGTKSRGPLEVFNDWFNAALDLPLPWTPRTDAHLQNWVIEEDGEGIVRLDLEAVGWAPFALELAQLTDDARLLDQSDGAWGVRRRCVDSYTNAIFTSADDQVQSAAWEAYLLSLAIRSARPLSRGGDFEKASRALALLDSVAARTTSPATQSLCADIKQSWDERRPGPTTAPSAALVELFEGGAQVRASKRLAHLLRHNTSVVRDEYGWADLAEVVDHFIEMKDYSKLDYDEVTQFVVTLVQRFDEARFEYRDGRVRAKYGQSVPVEYPPQIDGTSDSRPRLFHGTSYAAARNIFSSDGSLRPGSRSWVHLSTDVAEALRVASRHGEPLVLEVSQSVELLGDLIQASEHTWVSQEVPRAALRITPLHEFPHGALRMPDQ